MILGLPIGIPIEQLPKANFSIAFYNSLDVAKAALAANWVTAWKTLPRRLRQQTIFFGLTGNYKKTSCFYNCLIVVVNFG